MSDPPSSASSKKVVTDSTGKIVQVGDWLLGATIGSGSFGKVKLACHYRSKEKVAIKIVDKKSISNVEDVERVYRETFILTTLKHQNIIKLFEVLDTANSIMLVMEYAGGGELYTYVAQQQRLSEIEACRLFTQIINGVEYCHRAKIIHRDLKLENVLLANPPTTNNEAAGPPSVKIADFGLSNSIKFGQEKMLTNCGTPSYTCPEQIIGKQYVGSAADIWSLGVILFAMIAGFLPFEAPSIPLLFKKIKAAQYKCPGYMSVEVQDFIDKMLTVDPDKRGTIAELRGHPWMLMEYTDLADRIEAQATVTQEQINEARITCQAWTLEDERKENNNNNNSTLTANTRDKDKPKEEQKEDNTSTTPTTTSTSPDTATIQFNPYTNPRPGPTTGSKGGVGTVPTRHGFKDRDSRPVTQHSTKPSHSIFDKLSIRTNTFTTTPLSGGGGGGGVPTSSGGGRNSRAKTLTGNAAAAAAAGGDAGLLGVTSPSTPSSSGGSANSGGGGGGSSGSGLGSARHRKSISGSQGGGGGAASNSGGGGGMGLEVGGRYRTSITIDEGKGSQPSRFPPISPSGSASSSLSQLGTIGTQPEDSTNTPIGTSITSL